jgi:hypothetical protein
MKHVYAVPTANIAGLRRGSAPHRSAKKISTALWGTRLPGREHPTKEEIELRVQTAYNKLERTREMAKVAQELLSLRTESRRVADQQLQEDAALRSQADAAAAHELDAKTLLLQSQLEYIQARDEMTEAMGQAPEWKKTIRCARTPDTAAPRHQPALLLEVIFLKRSPPDKVNRESANKLGPACAQKLPHAGFSQPRERRPTTPGPQRVTSV